MIKKITAQKIASNWHSGQWSALYSFASTGNYCIELHLMYLKEIEDCLHPEYALFPGTLLKKDKKELIALQQYIILMGQKDGLYTQFGKHSIYGYLIPFIAGWVKNDIAIKVKPLSYPI